MDIQPIAFGASGEPRRASVDRISIEFEATMLRPLVEVMLPRSETAFGTGIAGESWRGMFADALAREIAEAGGIGLARLVDASAAGDGP